MSSRISRDVRLDPDAVDWATWIWAPPNPVVDPGSPDVETWLAQAESLLWGESGPPSPSDGDAVRQMLALFAAPEYPDPDGGTWTLKLLHLPGPYEYPLAVMVEFLPADGEREQVLRDLVRADDPSTVEPALVEQFSTDLGAGLRSLAYSAPDLPDGAGILLATVSYAWRVVVDDDWTCDIRLWASGPPTEVLAAADDLERLAQAVKVMEVHDE